MLITVLVVGMDHLFPRYRSTLDIRSLVTISVTICYGRALGIGNNSSIDKTHSLQANVDPLKNIISCMLSQVTESLIY